MDPAARPDGGARHRGAASPDQSALAAPRRGVLEETIRGHFEPLFDAAFDELLRRHYPRGIAFVIDGQPLACGEARGRERVTVPIRLGRKRLPQAIAILERWAAPLPESQQGIAISTYGKVIKRGWDWLGLTPAAAQRITGMVEAPDLAACLTLSKNDFVRSGPRGATYLAYRKAIQEVVSRQLDAWGDTRDVEARPRSVRLERDLARVLEDLADEFPLLRSLVDQRAGGQNRLPLPGRGKEQVPGPLFASLSAGDDAEGAAASSPGEKRTSRVFRRWGSSRPRRHPRVNLRSRRVPKG